MTTSLPDLWIDWCFVVGLPTDQIDDSTLSRFARQTNPPQHVLNRLRHVVAPEEAVAPAWPPAHHDSGALRRLVKRVSMMIQDPTTQWVLRLRLRRMLFAAVLIAPTSHGGLGFDRAGALEIQPEEIQRLRPFIGMDRSPESCPACAVWSWLDVVGTNNKWPHKAVRDLGHRRDDIGYHRHRQTDPRPEWCISTGMLPAIDRWGWVDAYSSMHPSSLSAVISAMNVILTDLAPVPVSEPEPQPVKRHRAITSDEEDEIFARADEITARINDILRDYN